MAMRTSVAASAALTSTRGAQGNREASATAATGAQTRTRADAQAAADDEDTELALATEARTAARADRIPGETRARRWQRKTYAFLSDASSSRAAFAFSVYFNLLIIFSTAAFCAQTIPSLNNSPEDARVWWTIEIFVIAQFTVEFVLRFACAPRKGAFLRAPLNIVDMVVIFPFYLELIVVAAVGSASLTFLAAIRVIRLARIFRLFKLGQQSKQVRMVARAFARSRNGVFLLAFMLGISVTFFSTCLYFAETAACTLGPDYIWYYNADTKLPGQRTNFQSIFASFWWATVTMTTVGYGDVYPITTVGKIIAAIATVTGLLVIAFPITIIGVNLNDIYDEYREQEAKRTRVDARARARKLAQTRSTDKPIDVTPIITEVAAIHLHIHDELNTFRKQLRRLEDVRLHASAMASHILKAHEANEAMAARARQRANERAGLGSGNGDAGDDGGFDLGAPAPGAGPAVDPVPWPDPWQPQQPPPPPPQDDGAGLSSGGQPWHADFGAPAQSRNDEADLGEQLRPPAERGGLGRAADPSADPGGSADLGGSGDHGWDLGAAR